MRTADQSRKHPCVKMGCLIIVLLVYGSVSETVNRALYYPGNTQRPCTAQCALTNASKNCTATKTPAQKIAAVGSSTLSTSHHSKYAIQ